MTAPSRSTPSARCAAARRRKPRRATLRICTRHRPSDYVARLPWLNLKPEIKARDSTSAVLAISCAWCTYIRCGRNREEEHDGPVLEGDAIRDRQCGRTAALGADDRDGVPARARHVRGYGRRADHHGVRP